MKNQKDNPFSWNDTISKMNDQGMFNTHVNHEDRLTVVSKMLNSIETNGLAMEECTQAELMDYICEIKHDIQDVINYIENGN